METLLEYIRRKGLVARGAVNTEKVTRLSKGQALHIAEDLVSLTPPQEQGTAGAIYAHCASISLGGGRDDCIWIGCRRERLDSLARFAALYSDCVFMRNFFCDYEHRQMRSVGDLRRTLGDDLALILHISPLLERGVLTLVSEPFICPNCLGKALGFGPECGREFRRAWDDLAKEILDRLVVTAVQRGSWISVKMSCPGPYSECNRLEDWRRVPPALQGKPRIMSQLAKGTRVRLPRTAVEAMRIHCDMAGQIVHSVAYHAVINRYLGTSFLTNKELELDFLNRASGDTALERRNSVAMKHLTALVPFVNDVPLSKLCTLRKREAESLARLRSALNRVLSEFARQESRFSARLAQQLYGDVLAPELARLDNKVRKAKQDLVSSTTRPLVGVVGAISFGLLSGLIPAEVAQVAQAVGITSFGAAFLEKLMALGDAERVIQQDDFYFLWRVRKLAKRRKVSHS